MVRQMYDVIIIGGGVIGCAIARSLSSQRRKVLILEKELDVGLHASGRDIGIVHSGFHQKPGSLAARLCVEGNYALRKYAESRRVSFEQIGTYVVATDESELAILEKLKGRGDRNGVPNLRLLPVSHVRDKEPSIVGHTVLHSETGALIDSRAFIKALVNDATKSGATIFYLQEVMKVQEYSDKVCVTTQDGQYESELVVNCTGVYADRLAHAMGVGLEYMILPFRRIYFAVKPSGPPVTQSMVYPVNENAPFGSGMAVSKTLQGTVIVGPSVLPAVDREAYDGRQNRLKRMTAWAGRQAMWKAVIQNRRLLGMACQKDSIPWAQQRLWNEASMVIKGLHRQDLLPGRRVEICSQLLGSDGQFVDDLVIESTDRTIHVLNMVSPGLTCSLSFAKWLTDRMQNSRHGTSLNAPSLASVS